MKTPALLLVSALLVSAATHAAPADDAATVAELDREYQLAVKRNDAATMARILADDFVLIAGNGTVHDREALLAEARSASVQYEQQDELEQQVRVWGDTAVVSARLWVKGTRQGQAFDRKLWFSDVYVRTADGWRYVLGQVGQRE
jgi:ketosteroid isomerase-like protein